ncbi:hypothetical protein FA95DRAFT_1490529 [Auriscalpium vulgare]|uniref:Uncharacterized protein n=1 Tax=Auriscalpium vulgare TaxID=40419 RepID=A0ACB8RXY2_9AGAM|nr:hypothetical protein FA95DRAFT_1490529 [Auriscalpium vulgare]
MHIVSVPLRSRQIGNLQCNLDRAGIVLSLAGAKGTVSDLATSNTTDASNIQTVANGIAGAQGAIGVIGKALITGQTAPADARTQVGGNLTQAITTLANIKSDDADTSSKLATAAKQLNDSATAGAGVVSNCK